MIPAAYDRIRRGAVCRYQVSKCIRLPLELALRRLLLGKLGLGIVHAHRLPQPDPRSKSTWRIRSTNATPSRHGLRPVKLLRREVRLSIGEVDSAKFIGHHS